MKKLLMLGGLGVLPLFMIGSCSDGTSSDLEVVDLNIVLDKFIEVAELETEVPADQVEDPIKDELMTSFVRDYTTALNKAPLYKEHQVGIEKKSDGSFLGYVDDNKNGSKDSGDSEVFLVEIDSERSRLIASDLAHNYRRDAGISPGMGFLGGYLMARMLTGQRNAGVNTGKFKNMKMNDKNYHSKAKSEVASKRSSARSKSGSGSFRSGK